ncbi:hypothetical protein GF345_02975 [Candidatus Woesearchaeota archaeon]|nr:hypothetical protein [Candidatus Woesearchaeota archaeon]
MDTTILESAGLTTTETRIYLMLLKSGSSLAGRITRETGIHRRSVYDSLERLMEKGLVSQIKTNNRRYFQAENPKRISDILGEKQAAVESIMPELQAMKGIAAEDKETSFYKGKSALRSIFNDQIEQEKEILVLGGSENVNEIMGYYFMHYDNERKKRGIRVRIIFRESAKHSDYVRKIPLADIRFLPDEYSSPLAINIYSDRAAIILWSEEPVGILIKEKEIAEGYRKYFEMLWQGARK